MPRVKFAISGASGWLGRELVFYLLRSGKIESLSEIRAYSSSKKILDFGEFGKIETEQFIKPDFSELAGVETFVHLAFLTRNLVDKYGREIFFEKNSILTQQATKVIEKAGPQFVVNVSSGAVFSRQTGNLDTDAVTNPYGVGKLQEEHLLQEACAKSGSNLAIGRLWGSTGEHMPINRAYAISDFIYMALREKKIKVKSRGFVWRRYCDAGEFLFLLWKLSRENQFTLINSGGPKIEIGELAELIGKEIEGVELEREKKGDSSTADYHPIDNSYEEAAKSFNVTLSSMIQQVQKTVIGHRKLLTTLD